MTLRKRAKVLLYVWSYEFYDTTLSTDIYIYIYDPGPEYLLKFAKS